jgi:hypothetical protein
MVNKLGRVSSLSKHHNLTSKRTPLISPSFSVEEDMMNNDDGQREDEKGQFTPHVDNFF